MPWRNWPKRVKILLDWITYTLWQPRPGMGWALEIYRAFNFVEALAWFVFAALGLSDVREVFVLQPWLIPAKGGILTVLPALRSIVIRRQYRASRTI